MTYEESLQVVEHRPYPLPAGMWRMRQRWRDLLFAHWPIPVSEMQALLPASLEADTYDGFAWIAVVPFWMDQVQVRFAGKRTASFPTTETFPELNLRTYVRSRRTGRAGIYFFSLDCASWLAVAGARTLFHLPYFPAAMHRQTTGASVEYRSKRLLTSQSVRFDATYRTLGEAIPQERGSLAEFLTERYRLFTESRGRLLVGEIHHELWPLERAEAEIRLDEIPAMHGITLPQSAPVLYFSRALQVTIWGLQEDR